MKVILGVDPGSYHTGYGVLQADGDGIRHVAHGVISAAANLSFAERLHRIGTGIQTIFEVHRPHITVIERVFLGRNADSAFKLGHVRGVCLFGASRIQSAVVEYAPRAMKKGITGKGNATKEQVQLLVFAALGLSHNDGRLDASDALGLAFLHARDLEVEEALSRNRARLRGEPRSP